MPAFAVVDTSALLASLDRRDPAHQACVEVLGRRELHLVIPVLVVAELAYLAGGRLGSAVEAQFVRTLNQLDVEAPTVEDWPRVADLVERYADLGLGTTDASIAVLADRLDTDLVITLDRRHFPVIRSSRGRPFRLLPDTTAVHEQREAYESSPA